MTIAPSELPTRDYVLANNLQSLSPRKFPSNEDGRGEGPVYVESVLQPGQRNSRKEMLETIQLNIYPCETLNTDFERSQVRAHLHP
jgi:hypothetical protein